MNIVILKLQSERARGKHQLEKVRTRLHRIFMERIKATVLLCLLFGSSGSASSAQVVQGTVGITGRVSPSVKLSLGHAWQQQAAAQGLFFTAESVGTDIVRVTIGGATLSPALQLALPLEIRTNVPYEMKLVVLSSQGCAPAISTSVVSIRSSGRLVSPGAAEGSQATESFDLMSCINPANALRGSRISAGGNFNSLGNALLADMNLSISPNRQPCFWRVVFQISLHPSQ